MHRVIQPPPTDTAALDRIRRLARLLDTSIPLPGGYRIGWDAIIGLIPGFGDGVGAVLSAYIVIEALRLGASKEVVTRMVGNVAVEALFGAVPFLGDVFDAAFKANVRNVQLLETHLGAPVQARRASKAWIIAVVVTLVVVLIAAMILAALGIRALLRAGGQ